MPRSRASSRSPARGASDGDRGDTSTPEFRKLTAAAARRVLARNQLGRIAYTLHDKVEVQPIHYVVDGRWLYLRTSPGTKTAVLSRNRWIAFQTDEVESVFSWRSVLVRGTAYTLSEDAVPDIAARYRRAVRHLRKLNPRALTAEDPVPFRSVVLGIHIEEIIGREARVRRRTGASRGQSGS